MKNDGFTFRKRARSFKFAFNGIKLLITKEHNAWIHCFAAVCVLIAGVVFGLSRMEWIAVTIVIGAVLAAEAVNSAKRDGHKIVAIGTTVMRTVETAVSTNGMIKPMEGWTNKFIFAPYDFTVADAMVTNFHLPYSTQLMMVAAFGGYETVMNAYKVAKEEGYRFGTYGDAMLIL